MAFALNREPVNQRAHSWDPTLKETWGASPGASLDGVDATVYAWTAVCFAKPSGKDLRLLNSRFLTAYGGGRRARNWICAESFDVFRPANYFAPKRLSVDSPLGAHLGTG